MDKEKFMLYYSFIINTLFLFILVFGGIIFADSNGVWHRAEDVQGGIFGSDENVISYTFNSDVYFNSYLRSGIYYINIDEITALNDLRSEKITANSAEINGDLNVTGILSSGKIILIDIVIVNSACTPNGILARDLNGLLLSCQLGSWKIIESAWSKAASQCTTNGWVYTGGSCQQISSFTVSSPPPSPSSCPSSSGCYGYCILPAAEHGTHYNVMVDITLYYNTCNNGVWING